MAKPYPREFGDDVVAVAGKGRARLNQLAKDFGICEGCLHNWMKKADVADGNRPGLDDEERKAVAGGQQADPVARAGDRGPAPGGPPTCPRRTCREDSLPARA